MASVVEVAVEYAAAGRSVIPLRARDKKPAIGWQEFQKHIPDEQTIRRTFHNDSNIGVVMGAVSGGMEGIDFDTGELYEPWKEKVGDLIDGLPVETAGKGPHVFWRSENPNRNLKLAFVRDENEITGKRIAIETRGEGGFFTVYPSIHPSGKQYARVKGTLADVPMLSQDQVNILLDAARSFDQFPQVVEIQPAVERAPYEGDSVIKAFDVAHPIQTMLSEFGYQRVGNKFVHPGSKGRDADITIKDGKSHHFSTNDPLEQIPSCFTVNNS